MKKFIAVLLAMLMMFSVCTVAFAADGDEQEPAGDSQVVENAETDEAEESSTPSWLTNLINRLMEVLAKVLAKVGIKLALKNMDFSDILNPSQPSVEAE